jgi:hypothetical protein
VRAAGRTASQHAREVAQAFAPVKGVQRPLLRRGAVQRRHERGQGAQRVNEVRPGSTWRRGHEALFVATMLNQQARLSGGARGRVPPDSSLSCTACASSGLAAAARASSRSRTLTPSRRSSATLKMPVTAVDSHRTSTRRSSVGSIPAAVVYTAGAAGTGSAAVASWWACSLQVREAKAVCCDGRCARTVGLRGSSARLICHMMLSPL